MRAALAIARKELNIYFTTPLAYVLLMVVAFFGAQFFNGALDGYRFWATRALTYQQPQALEHMNLTDMVLGRLFGSIGVFIIIAAPFMSMRLLAGEKRHKTFELLMTSPVKPFSIVVGKYLASLVMVLAVIGICFLFPVILALFGEGTGGASAVEWQTVFTGLLGLFLLGAMAMAVGMFVSALTESEIAAGLISMIFLIGLWASTIFTIGTEGTVKELASALSSSEHLGSFITGRLELKDLVYYLSFVTLGLFLTGRAVEGHRWT
jgi:ABC-2 type transport system permease protein